MGTGDPGVAQDGGAPAGMVRAWDVPTRLFHWTLVLLVISAYASRKLGDPVISWGGGAALTSGPPEPWLRFDATGLVWHTWTGYAILILVVYRVLWGFVGGSTARFASFLAGPRKAIGYGLDFARGKPRHFLGHNPLGGAMVVALLLVLGFQAVMGLMAYDDHDAMAGGPLAARVGDAWSAFWTGWHVKLFDLILILIGAHIAANLVYLLWKGENLVRPMITGLKPRRAYEDLCEAQHGSGGRAVICLVGSAVLVLGTVKLIAGRVF